MGVMGSLSPPSSGITSSSNNLDLTLSLALSDPSPIPPLKDETPETRESDTNSIKLFGFTIDVDNAQQTPTPKSHHIKLPSFFCERVMHVAGGDILGIMNSGQNNPFQASQVIGEYMKELRGSDVNACCRLMIKKQFVTDNVIPFLNDFEKELVQSEVGYYVTMFDVDTRTEHGVKLKLWKSTNTYVFTKWSQNFVKRRSLKKGDTVSLSWNARKFYFSVVQRAIEND